MQPIGKYIMLLGLGIALVGGIIWLLGPRLDWFGRLPGDVRVNRPGFKVFAPFTTMLLLSILISLVLWVIRRFFG
ncbi:DUF2905 domain-containing protein [Rufibacter glacialis]|uniref:DUF2905 domain-containing protein n=1 Tax=Rufibacter glacialis TaxID=1259555 RepID=A0A5M8QDP0_9BACT|nr:DUF2905 domain-containing protein [Rufibacter glacialis]KAA6432542.1 DUF2905 domain-containing protein [Rufibacter glacialis]GGK79638.1 hypothetical protein GCM10011405_29310 [Rufibacter glacialis]